MGLLTMDFLRYPSSYPRRTPSSMAAPISPSEILTSLPSSTKKTAYPVSWQKATHRSRATSAFSRRRSITSRPSSDSSTLSARLRAARCSCGRRVFASMHRLRTASVIELAAISRIVLLGQRLASEMSCFPRLSVEEFREATGLPAQETVKDLADLVQDMRQLFWRFIEGARFVTLFVTSSRRLATTITG